MKKILLLAYYFPPLGMGGTQRVAKFVKYLPQFGWKPYVVTVKDVAYYAKDPTLLEGVPNAKIYRTGSLDPQRLLFKFFFRKTEVGFKNNSSIKSKWEIINKLITWILVPDSKLLWLPFVIPKAVSLIKDKKIDYLLTTSPPHSVHLAGLILKWITGVSWAADFRDGWSGGNFQYEPTSMHKWINRLLEKRVLRKADKVIGVSQKLVENFKNKVPEQEDKFSVITNGFDYEGMSNIEEVPPNEKFTIVFCGTITSISPVDSFLEGLGHLLQEHPDLRDDISIQFIGVDLDGKAEQAVLKLDLQGVVKVRGYLYHREALKEIVHADLLLYPIASWASRDFIPGKTFEYLASENPVLAIGPEVEGVKILKETVCVVRVEHDNLDEIEQAILKFHHLYKQKSKTRHHKADISKYERKRLTERLANILLS